MVADLVLFAKRASGENASVLWFSLNIIGIQLSLSCPEIGDAVYFHEATSLLPSRDREGAVF